MEPIYIIFIAVIGIIILIGIGLEVSKGIDDFVIYILFWMLYIITIVTFINIVLVGNYYLTMRNKQGPPGLPGPSGDIGNKGDAGLCDPACRDGICETQVLKLITDELKARGQGVSANLNNIYIKSKVRQMCGSDEFKQLSPYNGPYNLINYVKDIWKLWFDLIYNAGGSAYFENVGAESDFDWLTNNPFDELKKYDIFYWGMGKQYRPLVSESCYLSSNGNTPNQGSTNSIIIKTSNTNIFESIGDDSGSGAGDSVSFWRAKQFTYQGSVYYPLGDIVIGPSRNNDNKFVNGKVGTITMPYGNKGPARETIIASGDLEGPIGYELIWKYYTRYRAKQFYIWRPIAPTNYVALGDVVTFTSSPPLTGDSAPIRCVPSSIAIRKRSNGNKLWSSIGSKMPTNVTLVGFSPNYGGYVTSSESNAYNLFRAVIGTNNTNIPASDVNASFYTLDNTKYDSGYKIGMDTGIPSDDSESSRVGKGYIPSPKKDAKYSVMSYLNLKTNPVLVHSFTKLNINGKLIPNAISNAYLLNINNSCINYEGVEVKMSECDELKTGQIFSILFTGNKKNECKLQHHETKNILTYKNSLFTLVPESDTSNLQYQYFIMQ